MAMENRNPAPVGETRRVTTSRRHALALMLGASRWLSAAPAGSSPPSSNSRRPLSEMPVAWRLPWRYSMRGIVPAAGAAWEAERDKG
jgi:hypothetical protein